jgi:hypothetical protein
MSRELCGNCINIIPQKRGKLPDYPLCWKTGFRLKLFFSADPELRRTTQYVKNDDCGGPYYDLAPTNLIHEDGSTRKEK